MGGCGLLYTADSSGDRQGTLLDGARWRNCRESNSFPSLDRHTNKVVTATKRKHYGQLICGRTFQPLRAEGTAIATAGWKFFPPAQGFELTPYARDA